MFYKAAFPEASVPLNLIGTLFKSYSSIYMRSLKFRLKKYSDLFSKQALILKGLIDLGKLQLSAMMFSQVEQVIDHWELNSEGFSEIIISFRS